MYIIQSKVTGAFKVGRTSDPQRRLKQLQTGSPYTLRLVLVLPGQGGRERELQRRLARHSTKGEWFAWEGLSELPDEVYEQLDLDVVDEWWR